MEGPALKIASSAISATAEHNETAARTTGKTHHDRDDGAAAYREKSSTAIRMGNGSELLGPTQGHGWIDENDTIFGQLRTRSPTDQCVLEAGIGTLSLQASSTPSALKDGNHQTLGSVRAGSL